MKRFWKDASVERVEGGWQVALDGRPLRTQGHRAQVVPSEALAQMLALEWARQGEDIDPGAFVHRDMADFALDRIATGEDDVAGKLVAFAETDTLCYRADPDDPVFRRQEAVWEPILTALEEREGVRMERVSGIVHRPQPAMTLDTLRARVARLDAFQLAALLTMSSLSASLAIGLAALETDADARALWNAANLEEHWQAEQWGEDAEAAGRRARRLEEFAQAFAFARAAREP